MTNGWHTSCRIFALTLLALLCVSNASAQVKRIPANHSKIDVRIDGLDPSALRYYYAKTEDETERERYVAHYYNATTGQYLLAQMDIVLNDEFYWDYIGETTVETLKENEHLRDKSIRIAGMSDGMNAGYDSAAGDPNYLIFTADHWNCGVMRRLSIFGPHGGTSNPYVITALYCAPSGKNFTPEQAAEAAKTGLIYHDRQDHLGNDLYPPPKF